MANYEVWLARDDGTRLALLDDWEALEYVQSAHSVGSCSMTLPGDWSTGLFAADRKLEIWRKSEGGALSLERVYLIAAIGQDTDAQGISRIRLEGVDGNDLLRRHIVAYAGGSTQATMNAPADNMMKAIVRQNLSTAATSTARTLSLFSVQANSSQGPSVSKAFSRRDVLGVCQEIAEASKQSTGPRVYFDVMSPVSSAYEFRTYPGHLGADHTYPNGVNPVLLGQEYGNLTEPKVVQDYSEEVTVVYGGGQGEGASRYVYEIEDSARSGRSIWGRKEAFRDARTEASSSGVADEARAALAEGRPKLRFSGKILDSPGTVYGLHWRWGDWLSASYRGQIYNAPVDVVRVRRTADREEIEARLEQEEST